MSDKQLRSAMPALTAVAAGNAATNTRYKTLAARWCSADAVPIPCVLRHLQSRLEFAGVTVHYFTLLHVRLGLHEGNTR
jgi:hypothetical protein